MVSRILTGACQRHDVDELPAGARQAQRLLDTLALYHHANTLNISVVNYRHLSITSTSPSLSI